MLEQAENLDVAFELVQEMAEMGVQTDAVTYTTLMDLCAEARQGQRAVELMQVSVFICSFICSYLHSFVDSSIHSLVDSSIHSCFVCCTLGGASKPADLGTAVAAG